MAGKEIKWASTVAHVREVSLLGAAELPFWKDRLKAENLLPAERDGRAQIMIVAADLKFMGIRFRELSISVLVRETEKEAPADAAFLLAAWNTSRLFAFCERMFFSTPYVHGDVRVSASVLVSIAIIEDGQPAFAAQMQTDTAAATTPEPSHRGQGGWAGPVFLPTPGGGTDHARKLFFAEVAGHTETYPFQNSQDALTIRPATTSHALRALVDSRFTPQEWTIRENATHAKSKTYGRADAPMFVPRFGAPGEPQGK